MSILDISAATYHADDVADRPTLSASIAHLLTSQSPLHAWTAHPKLNPDFAADDDPKFSIGTVVHAMLLQGEDVAVQIDADSWRTNAAKEARDAAYAAGQTPLLTKDWDRCRTMVDAAWKQIYALQGTNPSVLADGLPEQTLVWEEPNGVLCRSRLDWLTNDFSAIDDLKTTARSANPEQWSRTMFSIGTDLKAAFYLRGLKAVTGATAVFRWVIVETSPPYALSVLSPDPAVLAHAEAKVEHAIQTWGKCLETDTWPGYPSRVCYAELPPWEEFREDEVAA